MKSKLPVWIILAALGSSCKSMAPEQSVKPAEKIIIYQMLPRLFGNTQSLNKTYGSKEENGTGKFNDISSKALNELKAMGVSHIWYTGVLEHATMSDHTAFGIPA